jgi:hypothetical protein
MPDRIAGLLEAGTDSIVGLNSTVFLRTDLRFTISCGVVEAGAIVA